MSKLNLSTFMNLIPAVGPLVAAIPEFEAMIHEVAATFGPGKSQDDLKAAYARALAGAEAQHEATQAAAKGNS